MKICFFSAEYPPETHSGGIGTYTHGMASALAGLGHEVHVIAATGKDERDVQADGIRVHRIRKKRMKPKELGLLAYSHAVGKKARQAGCRFDIVQASEFGGEAFWYSLGKRAPLITRFATPFFLTEQLNDRTIFGPRPVLNWLEKQQALRSDGLFASTKALARVIAEEWGIGLSRVRVIPNGLDLARVVRLGASNPCPEFLKDKDFLLYFGRLEERKGIRVLGNALPALLRRYPHLYMVFVGSDLGYHGSSLREYIRERAAEDRSRVLFFDNLAQEELFPIVNRATMVILPSLWEAFGFVCVEAMVLGRPVVATSGSGFEEIIADEESGFLVEPGNSPALARKISECLDDAARLSRVSEGAVRRARDFDASRIAAELLDYYHEVQGAWQARRPKSQDAMGKTRRSAQVLIGRDVFRSGQYLRYFNPDDPRNPFFRLYERKRREVADLVLQSQGPGRILDIGGGGGRLVRALDEPAQARTVLADISEDMLQFAKKTGGNKNGARLVSADAHRLPFRDRSFDTIVGLDLLCHLDEPSMALREFHRVLTDRGILILDSSNSNPLWTFFYPRYLGRNPLNWLRIISAGGVSPGWRRIVKHYPKKTFFSFLERAGFEITRRVAYGPAICPKWHLAVARKKDQAG